MPAPHFPKSATLDLTGPLPWQGTTHDDVLGAKERRAFVLEGLAGDDTLYGSYGDDIYIWNIGDGSDTFTEPEFGGGDDLIRFGAGITRNDLSFRVNRFSSDLLIDVASDVGVETLAISFQHSSPLMGRTIETAEFADGSTLDLTGPLPLRGTTGDDVIFSDKAARFRSKGWPAMTRCMAAMVTTSSSGTLAMGQTTSGRMVVTT